MSKTNVDITEHDIKIYQHDIDHLRDGQPVFKGIGEDTRIVLRPVHMGKGNKKSGKDRERTYQIKLSKDQVIGAMAALTLYAKDTPVEDSYKSIAETVQEQARNQGLSHPVEDKNGGVVSTEQNNE